MLIITKALKNHMVSKFALAESADDDATRKLVFEKLGSDNLSMAQFTELCKPDETDSPGPGKIKSLVTEEVTKAIKPIEEKFDKGIGEIKAALGIKPADDSNKGGEGDPTKSTDTAVSTAVKATLAQIDAMVSPPAAQVPTAKADGSPREALVAGEGTGGTVVRTPAISKDYDCTRKGAYYNESKQAHVKRAFGSMPVMCGTSGYKEGVVYPMNHPSQFDLAVAGAWYKFAAQSAARSQGMPLSKKYTLSDHDKQLVQHAMHEMEFSGCIHYDEKDGSSRFSIANRKMADYEIKGLLDDSISGGLEAAPIVFDSAVILTPLLHGELFPLVNLINLPRGRRVEGFSMGNPTFQWGTGEGTEIGLFNTDAFIAAFDTTIFPATGAMAVGNDFEEDTPTNIGAQVVANYGQAALATLDYVVAVGNGTTQPQGVTNASGIGSVNSDNGAGGPWSIGDMLGLLFGVSKAFRNEAEKARTVFISNDTTYLRTRNIKVDPATPSTDQRLALVPNMNVEDYMTLAHPHKIQNDISNRYCGLFNLARYRMYRRLGTTVRIVTEGKSLALTNETLIVIRMRLGGQMELGGAGAAIEDGQS